MSEPYRYFVDGAVGAAFPRPRSSPWAGRPGPSAHSGLESAEHRSRRRAPRLNPLRRRGVAARHAPIWSLLACTIAMAACGGGAPRQSPGATTSAAPSPTAGVRAADPTPSPGERSATAVARPTRTPSAAPTDEPSPRPEAPVVAPTGIEPSPTVPRATPTPAAAARIAYVSRGAVYVAPAGGGPARRVAAGRNTGPAWRPGSPSTIAYIRLGGASGDGSLVVHEEGGRPRVVARGGVTQLAWSPDGGGIAYTRTTDTDGDGGLRPGADESEVRLLRLEGATDAPIAPGFDPSWAPDGRGILLSTNGRVGEGGFRERNELRLYPPSGGRGRRVASTADVPRDLSQYGTPFLSVTRLLRFGAVSLDGGTVAFSALGGTGVLGTVALGGGEVQVQDTLPESGFGRIAWQPGGSRFAYEVPTPSGVTLVTVLDVRTGNRASLGEVRAGTSFGHPAWSPDGSLLALARERKGGGRALVVANAEGRVLRTLRVGDVSSPTWGD